MARANFKSITTTGIDDDALSTTKAGDFISNFGVLQTSGDLADGIFGGADQISISNFSSIETTGRGAHGIFVNGANAHVDNFGSITTHGSSFDFDPNSDEDDVFSDAIAVNGDRFHIANYGNLEVTGNFSSAAAGIGNDGLLVNYGNVTSASFFAITLGVFGDRSRVVNAGDITVSGAFSHVLLASGHSASATNFADIVFSADNPFIGDETIHSFIIHAIGTQATASNFGNIEIGINASFTAGISIEGDGAKAINFGNITSDATGSAGIDVSGEGASAINYGHITGGRFGMSDQDAEATLANHGTISGVSIGMLGVDVVNYGLIELRQPAGIAMYARGGFADQPHIVNAGHIVVDNQGMPNGEMMGIGVGLGAGHAVSRDGTIENRGLIEARGDGAAGVKMTGFPDGGRVGDIYHLTNTGRITTDGATLFDFQSAAGVVVSADDAVIDNTRSGIIESKNATTAAVELNVHVFGPIAGLSSLLENEGTLKGVGIAVLGAEGEETVINRGRIIGDVDLGDGNDTFIFGKRGSLQGDLFLRGGDDLVCVDKGAGIARVADFVAGDTSGDAIDLSAFFASFSEIEARISQNGSDVVINLGHGNRLVLEQVQMSQLNANDFLFV
jgi:hypothetical protein